MTSRRDFVIFIIIGVALVLAGIVYFWSLRNERLSPKASENEVVLSLSTGSKSSYQAGETFSLEVFLAVGVAEAKEIKIHYLNFDPSLLQVQNVSMVELDGFSVINQSADNGQIELDERSENSSFSGSSKIAVVTFKALKSGTANFNFNLDSVGITQTAVINQNNQNILTNANSSKVFIN